MVFLSRKYFSTDTLFYFGFACFLFGLSVSKIVVSISLFIMAFAWLLNGNFKQNFRNALTDKVFTSLAGIYLIHLLGLINTSDFDYALKDLRIKLPLLILPFLMVAFKNDYPKYKDYILYFFWLGLMVGCVGTFYLYLGFGNKNITDVRYLSPFVSHIRFSLLLVFGILSAWHKYSLSYRKSFLLPIAIFLSTLFVLKALTGWVILGFVVVCLIYFSTYRHKKAILAAMLIFLLSFLGYAFWFYQNFFVAKESNISFSLNPRDGYTNLNLKEVENGRYVWTNVNELQLQKEWNKNSDIPYTGMNNKGQPIRNTLIRYLTSKGLSKDSAGIAQLTYNDFFNIKNGFTNAQFTNSNSFQFKLYQLLYEIHAYLINDFADNHSLTMRWLFAKNGVEIWKRNFWFGVGTGDVQKEFDWIYESNQTNLSKENRLRAHNQFITFGLTFGFFGLTIILYLLIRLFNRKSTMFNIAYSALLISFLNEDTLETQIGVSVFVSIVLLFNLLNSPYSNNILREIKQK